MSENINVVTYCMWIALIVFTPAFIFTFRLNTKVKELISNIIKEIKLDSIENDFKQLCSSNTNLNNYFVYKVHATRHRLKFTERFVLFFNLPSVLSNGITAIMFFVNSSSLKTILTWLCINLTVVTLLICIQWYLVEKYTDLIKQLS